MTIIASLIAAVAVASGTPGGQTPPASPAALGIDIPELEGATADPSCGGRMAMSQFGTCVVTTQAAAPGLMDAYDAAFKSQGWLAADGADNRVVYVRRKPEGGCDAFQVLAFAGGTGVASPAGPAHFVFALIPGDICTARTPAAAAPVQ